MVRVRKFVSLFVPEGYVPPFFSIQRKGDTLFLKRDTRCNTHIRYSYYTWQVYVHVWQRTITTWWHSSYVHNT